MNSFGNLLRVQMFGESHGPVVGVLLDGVPAGIAIKESDFRKELERRNPNLKGTTARKETDEVFILSGVFNNKTTGAPLLLSFINKDTDPAKYEKIKHTPRPGHADMASYLKYGGFNDYNGAGHFSGRLTVALVVAGVLAKKMLKKIKISAVLTELGGNIETAIKKGDSVGGIVECVVRGVPVGLGEPFFNSVESLVSHGVFSIPGVKGIEFGSGFKSAFMKGSEYNDEIINKLGKTKTNNAGGVNGGISNGNDIVFRLAVRPTASIAMSQNTVDLKTGKKKKIKVEGRHDVCFALRMPVIVEAVTALVVADLMLLEQKIRRISR